MDRKRCYSIIVENPSAQYHGGYSYLVRDQHFAYTAFKTEKGYNRFLEIANVKPELKEENNHPQFGLCQVYNLIGEITEILFWNLSQLPEGAITFKGGSNGGLVDCYYLHTENGSEIYRPNPNAKEVYHPLPLDEHLAFMKING